MTDAARFEAFVREYQDLVFGVALRLLANAAEAEDVSQTVFLKAFERFAEISESPAVAGWLKTVATNASLNYLSRYRARWRFFSELQRDHSNEGDQLDAVLVAAVPANAESDMDAGDRQQRLECVLQRLPDHQRVPLVLYHFEDKSYQEIAVLLGISLAKVKTDIHRGREALRKALTTNHGSA
jgi:RNA polymerase sigma-70 factor (ECF subfamily)